jgi:hypothetical protein
MQWRRPYPVQDATFSRPVTLFTREPDGSVGHVELATVGEGFSALNRGLEGFCIDHPEWHLAFHALSRAVLDLTPERVEAAREALDLLASLTRMTALEATRQRTPLERGARRVLH